MYLAQFISQFPDSTYPDLISLLLMSKKPHKIKHQYSDILPILDSPTFNQTIIINSPSFNIRVVGDRKKQPQ
jgi:hypothetical protein